MSVESSVQIFTDGSSLGNPGPGGFCAIVVYGRKKLLIAKGGEKYTTNNRMELSAVIAGLYAVHKKFPEGKKIEVFSDSNLIIGTLNHNWKRKKNLDLWKKLDALRTKFEKISWHWIRGHSGHLENTKADRIAVQEAKKRKRLQSE